MDTERLGRAGKRDDDHMFVRIEFRRGDRDAMSDGEVFEVRLHVLNEGVVGERVPRQPQHGMTEAVFLGRRFEGDQGFLRQGPQYMQAGARNDVEVTGNSGDTDRRFAAPKIAQNPGGATDSGHGLFQFGLGQHLTGEKLSIDKKNCI